MARKKTAKRQVSKRDGLSIIKKLEKDFLTAPAKLTASFNKAIKALKKQKSKLEGALNRISGQVKKGEKRLGQALQSTTSKGKKLAKTEKKALAKTTKNRAQLTKQLQQLTKSIEETANKQEKILALRKQLSQFEKEWRPTQSKSTANIKAKAKKSAIDAPKTRSNIQPTAANEILLEEIIEEETSESAT
ncbi:MAG TPA: hypothetical protein VHZ76_10985 [Gammaproteobacteria bacterium]|jgi:predicted  nucleic acid-binding Zn-ribbon protein|nr:hypothetical protein [Gammaproteobacteria bacterium]